MDLSTTFASIRKQVAGLSLVALVAGLFAAGVATAATENIFSDVPADAWYAGYVNDLATMGVVDSTKDMYRPGDQVNRAEMAKFAFMVSGLPLETATAAPYKDVAMGQWYTNYVYTLTKNGIVSGDKLNGVPTGYFRPESNLNRAEAAKMLVNAAAMAEDLSGAPHFPDVKSADWFYNFVETAFNNGVVSGYPDGMYRPANNIVRSEVAKMVYLSMSPVSAGFVLDSAAAASSTKVELIFSMNVDATLAADKANYVVEDSTGTKLSVSAAEVTAADTVVLTTTTQTSGKVYYVTVKNVESDAGDALANTDSVSFLGYGADVSGGALTVSLSTQTPVAGSIPQGATGVVFTCWDFKAGASAVVIKSLSVHRVGPGAETAFNNVYLYRGDTRVTTGRSINSDSQTAEFSNINQTVAAGENMKLCLVADIATAGANGGVHAFELGAADAIMSNSSNLTGSFPLRGADQLITSATVGTSTVTKNGVLDEITIGDEAARVAQFQITAGSSEDQALSRIALYFRGTARSTSFTNLKLYVEGDATVLASADSVGTNDLATFVLSKPFKIGRGENKIFYVTADVSGARTGETVKVYLDESTDVFITGLTYGYGTGVTMTGYDGDEVTPSVGDFSYAILKGAKFTLAFKGPSAGDIAVNQKQARCLDVNLTNSAGLDVTIKDWQVKIENTNLGAAENDANAKGLYDSTNANAANYTLVKLVRLNDDGTVASTLLGSSELPTWTGAANAGDVTSLVTIKGSTLIPSGETIKASVIFDVANQPLMDTDNIKCTLLAPTGADQIKDSNNDQLGADNITPNTGVPGNTMSIVKSALTVSPSGTLTAKTYTKGTMDAPLLALDFKGGTTSDVKLSTLNLKVTTNAASPSNLINSLSLYDGTTLLKGPVNVTNVVAPTGDIIFTGLSVTIPKGSSKVLTVKANVDSTISAGHNLGVFVDSALATDGAGSSITPDVSAIDLVGKAPVMTLIPATSLTAAGATVSTAESLITTGASTPNGLKFGMRTDYGTATLQDFAVSLTVGSTASVGTVSVYTGANCATPVANAQNVSVIAGTASITNANIPLTTSDTYICVRGKAAELDASDADPTTYGLEVTAVTKAIDSSGANIASSLGAFVPYAGADTFNVYASAPIALSLNDGTNAPSLTMADGYAEKVVGQVTLNVQGGSIKLNEVSATITASYTCKMKLGSTTYAYVGTGFVFPGDSLGEGDNTYDVLCSKVGGVNADPVALDITGVDFDSETTNNAVVTVSDITRNATNNLNY